MCCHFLHKFQLSKRNSCVKSAWIVYSKSKMALYIRCVIFQEFDEELKTRKEEVERLLRSLPAMSSAPKKSPRTPGGRLDNHEMSSPTPGAMALQRKWHAVLRMSADRSKKLQEVHQRLLEVSLKMFDLWRTFNVFHLQRFNPGLTSAVVTVSTEV
jgi:hypothetical protein